jgi:VanZ family protein
VRRSSEKPRASIDMLHKLVSVMAWACLLFVAAATLSPAYLRPRLTEIEPALIVIFEHIGAFAAIGFLFSLIYSRTTLVCLLVLGSAVILELLQLVVPDRDAHVIDALEKLIGGGLGIFAARMMHSHIFADSEPQPAPGLENEIS